MAMVFHTENEIYTHKHTQEKKKKRKEKVKSEQNIVYTSDATISFIS